MLVMFTIHADLQDSSAEWEPLGAGYAKQISWKPTSRLACLPRWPSGCSINLKWHLTDTLIAAKEALQRSELLTPACGYNSSTDHAHSCAQCTAHFMKVRLALLADARSTASQTLHVVLASWGFHKLHNTVLENLSGRPFEAMLCLQVLSGSLCHEHVRQLDPCAFHLSSREVWNVGDTGLELHLAAVVDGDWIREHVTDHVDVLLANELLPVLLHA
jgi:hypothetical protein